jgi:hypothetical protein
MKEQHFLIALLVTFPFVLIIVSVIISLLKKRMCSKKEITKSIWCVFLIYGCSMFMFYISLNNTDKETAVRNTLMEKEYSKIEFEGYISSVNVLHHYGTPQCLICVRITDSNVDSFCRFDKIGEVIGLKIKNNVASLPIGGYDANDSLNKYSYVQVNTKGNNLIIFSNKQGDTLKLPLSYRTGGLYEDDFNICDTKH